jgi:cell division protein FtsL
MAALAQPAPDAVPDVSVPRPRPRKSAKAQRRVASGVVWIAVFALLLGGVVALSVAVLRLNITLDRLGSERVKLRAENASLASQLSSAAAAARIHALASQKLGLVPAEPSETYYVDITPR